VTDRVPGSNDVLRNRLQLAVGGAAVLGEELPASGGRRLFEALDGPVSSPGGAARLRVMLYPRPSVGPDPAAVTMYLQKVRELAHPGLILPTASGDFEGHTWLAEPAPVAPTAREWLRDNGPFPIRDGVQAMRALARALTALQRRGLAHGAIALESVRIDGVTAQLSAVGASTTGTVRGDLDALALVAWALLTGEETPPAGAPLSRYRRGVPRELDALFAAMLAERVDKRPADAVAILDALDAIPTPATSPASRLIDGFGAGSRPRRTRAAIGVLAALAVVALLYWLSR
jgi:hypothetical protein